MARPESSKGVVRTRLRRRRPRPSQSVRACHTFHPVPWSCHPAVQTLRNRPPDGRSRCENSARFSAWYSPPASSARGPHGRHKLASWNSKSPDPFDLSADSFDLSWQGLDCQCSSITLAAQSCRQWYSAAPLFSTCIRFRWWRSVETFAGSTRRSDVTRCWSRKRRRRRPARLQQRAACVGGSSGV